MQTRQIRHFLIGTGSFLLLGGGVRFYRVMRSHTEDYFFAPHILLASLTLYIAWKVLKIGMQKEEKTRKEAISLIRSGSILMMIWGYRLFLLLSTKNPERGLGISPILAVLYVVMGTAVMCLGLKINRSFPVIRHGNYGH